MSDLFQDYVRKQFPVQAVLVTPLNIKELAELCGGKLMEDGAKEGNFSRQYIKIRVDKPLNERQTEVHVGDYLVRQGRKYKSYQEKQFRATFELKGGQAVPRPANQQQGKKPKTSGPNPGQMPKTRTSEPVPVTDEQVDKFRENLVATHPKGQTFVKEREATPEEMAAYHAEVQRLREEAATPQTFTGVPPGTPKMSEILEEKKEIVNPEAAQAVRTEDLHASPEPVSSDVLDGNARVIADAELRGVSLVPGTPENFAAGAGRIETVGPVPEAVVVEEPEHEDLAQQNPDEEEPAPKPITLDELETQAGDPRSAQEIMAETHPTPGEVFRGEA